MSTAQQLQIALEMLLLMEAGWLRTQAKSRVSKNPAKTRRAILNHLHGLRSPGNLSEFIAAEKMIVENDLINYSNSSNMSASLNAALKELNIIEMLLPIVADQSKYQLINFAHSLPKNREGNLPMDEARQAFRSHTTRLNNLDRARLSEDEKDILDARRDNLNAACKCYALMQAQALGV